MCCFLKGFMACHWFDIQSSWAAASGVAPVSTCRQVFGSGAGFWRDFVLGCPPAASALRWCEVLELGPPSSCCQGLFLYGPLVCSSLFASQVSVLWPAAWVTCLDKFRISKSPEFVVFGKCLVSLCGLFTQASGKVSVRVHPCFGGQRPA